MPLPWPWLGRDTDKLFEEALEKLVLPWDDAQEEWRGFQVVLSALLSTLPYHTVAELVIDTDYELMDISHQLFASEEQNTGYTTVVQLFSTIPLMRLELCLNTITTEETNFSCFHNGLFKTASSPLASLRRLALSTSIDTTDDENMLDSEEAWCDVFFIQVFAPKLQVLKLCNFLLKGESLLSAFEGLTSLSVVQLDCVSLSNDLTWHDPGSKVKNNLVGMLWKLNQLAMTFRRKASSLDLRLDSLAELAEFLYGDGECPFTRDLP